MKLANPSKKKGTAGEAEVKAILSQVGLTALRTSPGENYDLRIAGRPSNEPFQVLATRPDRGEWLATLRLTDLAELLRYYNQGDIYGAEIEVKRYARFSLHTIFNKKFGGKSVQA